MVVVVDAGAAGGAIEALRGAGEVVSVIGSVTDTPGVAYSGSLI